MAGGFGVGMITIHARQFDTCARNAILERANQCIEILLRKPCSQGLLLGVQIVTFEGLL